MPLRAAIYARALSPDTTEQVRKLKLHCEKQGYILDNAHIYKETEANAYFKYYTDRPELMQLLQYAHLGAFDVVCVMGLSRFSPRQGELLIILDFLKQANVEVKDM